MAIDFRKITVIGTLGRDAENRALDDGNNVVSFSIASNFKDKGNDQVAWFRCDWWGKRAQNVLNYLEKGKLVAVEGTFTPRPFTDKDGKERLSLDINVDTLQLLSPKDDSNNNAAAAPVKSLQDDLDDIPF